MDNINFVPEDYIDQKDCRRTNVIYLVLLVIAMASLVVVFMGIKVRQHAVLKEIQFVNNKLTDAQESIKQLEQMRNKHQRMLKTAFITSELIEPVPRSLLVAALTNSLPRGVSFQKLHLKQEKPKATKQAVSSSKYKASADAKTAKVTTLNAIKAEMTRERMLETNISIEGIAPSDIEVASYIARLSNLMGTKLSSGSNNGAIKLLRNVELVLSEEYKIDDENYRKFKLRAVLNKDVYLSKEDIDNLRRDRLSKLFDLQETFAMNDTESDSFKN